MTELTTRITYTDAGEFIEVRKKYDNKALRTLMVMTVHGRLCTKCLRRKGASKFTGKGDPAKFTGRHRYYKACVRIIGANACYQRALAQGRL